MADEEDQDEHRPFPALREARYSRALGRGLAILACFTPERPLLGIAELAQRLNVSRPTMHRYVNTLVSLGYLEQDATRKYRLAVGAIDLGAGLNAVGLCKHARPHLERLAERSGYAAAMAVLDGAAVLVVDQVPRPTADRRKPEEKAPPAKRLPAYCTSMGKALLAHLPRGPRAKLIGEIELLKRGPRTITSRAVLLAHLQDVSDEGIAIDDEELVEGACGIATPVWEESGDVIAAVGLTACGGGIELEELVNRFEGALRVTADRISRQIGWRGEEVE